jgi:L-ribulose-5-phosphate 4-epimerase
MTQPMDADAEPIDDTALRRTLVAVARQAETLQLVQHSQGNFSARIPGTNLILITPTGIPYVEMGPEDLVTVDLEQDTVRGPHRPSSELEVHRLTYRSRPWVGGCAHVEPPYLNALYALNRQVPNVLGNFVYLFAGRGLAVAPAIRSGTSEFAEVTLEAMGDRLGVVWKNHGIFCIGHTVRSALDRCVAAEQAAKVYYLALALKLGEPDLIPDGVQQEMVRTAMALDLTRGV